MLENGLSVILMEYRKVPVIHLRLVARGGAIDDPSGLEGVAGVTTSLMREGTETRNATEIARAIDLVGGTLQASAGLDYCAVSCEVLKKNLDTGLDLFADIILHPTFPDNELDRERKQRIAGLESDKEDPGTIASRAFATEVYGTHPYGRRETKVSLKDITRDELVAFHQRVFTPANSILCVVGDFSSMEMLSKLRSAFGQWSGNQKLDHVIPLPAKHDGHTVVLVDKADATQSQIRIGNTGVDINNPDYFSITVANTVFGGGFTSRLVDELRVKRSLTYGVGSGFPANMYGGSYSISTFTKNATLVDALDVVLAELKKFREKGATQEECQKAKSYIAGNFARGLQSPGALARQMTDIEIFGRAKDYLEKYIQNVRKVSVDDVRMAAQKYFLLDDLLFVIVAPADSAKSSLTKYGTLQMKSVEDVIQ
jgi:zinc protease